MNSRVPQADKRFARNSLNMEITGRENKRRKANVVELFTDGNSIDCTHPDENTELAESSGGSQDSIVSYNHPPCLRDDLSSNSGQNNTGNRIHLVDLPQNVIHMILVRAGIEATVEVACTCRTLRDYVWKVESLWKDLLDMVEENSTSCQRFPFIDGRPGLVIVETSSSSGCGSVAKYLRTWDILPARVQTAILIQSPLKDILAGPELPGGNQLNWYHIVRQRCLPSWLKTKEKRQTWKNFFNAQMHDIVPRKAKYSIDYYGRKEKLEIIERQPDGKIIAHQVPAPSLNMEYVVFHEQPGKDDLEDFPDVIKSAAHSRDCSNAEIQVLTIDVVPEFEVNMLFWAEAANQYGETIGTVNRDAEDLMNWYVSLETEYSQELRTIWNGHKAVGPVFFFVQQSQLSALTEQMVPPNVSYLDFKAEDVQIFDEYLKQARRQQLRYQ